jgi:hypothetical protein
MDNIREFIRIVLDTCINEQTPFLLQPLWATDGRSMDFDPMIFDMLVWTDHAILTLVYRSSLDRFMETAKKNGLEGIGRPQRAVIRMARTFAELLSKGSFNYDSIYKDIIYDGQSDKELSIRGIAMLRHVPASVFADRRVSIENLSSIIPPEAINFFSPERRLDTALFIHMSKTAPTESINPR